MTPIQQYFNSFIRGKTKRMPSGRIAFNGSCCTHNGEGRTDSRMRSGVFYNIDGSITVVCKNCKYKANYVPGSRVSRKFNNLLKWMGASELDIARIYFLALDDTSTETAEKITSSIINKFEIPKSAKTFSSWAAEENVDTNFLNVVQYVVNRGEYLLENEFYWSPDQKLQTKLIIPVKLYGNNIGWIARETKDSKFRYQMNCSKNIFFNQDHLYDQNRKIIILTEGIFDALAIDGIASFGNELVKNQIDILKTSNKRIIVLPDRDKTGYGLVKSAVENNWEVAMPEWDNDIKDASEAAKQYGRLFTAKMILKYVYSGQVPLIKWNSWKMGG